jgi:hypothetical protein
VYPGALVICCFILNIYYDDSGLGFDKRQDHFSEKWLNTSKIKVKVKVK